MHNSKQADGRAAYRSKKAALYSADSDSKANTATGYRLSSRYLISTMVPVLFIYFFR